jgi:hypothetical protein
MKIKKLSFLRSKIPEERENSLKENAEINWERKNFLGKMNSLLEESPEEESPETQEQESIKEPQKETDSTFLDVFKSEEIEESSLKVLVDGLEEIKAHKLLQESREIARQLRENL